MPRRIGIGRELLRQYWNSTKLSLRLPEGHYPVLDAFRGVAILMVVFSHFTNNGELWFGAQLPINLGRLGVELFFAISGFLMGGILFVRHTPLKEFYAKRFARIIPALLFYLSLVWGWFVFRGVPIEVNGLMSTFFMYTNYFLAFDAGVLRREFHHIWSLCIEEHSYIVLSSLALLSRKFFVHSSRLILLFIVAFMSLGLFYSLKLGWDYYEVRAASIFIPAFFAVKFAKRNLKPSNGICGILLVIAGVLFSHDSFSDTIKYTLGTTLIGLGVCLSAKMDVNRIVACGLRPLQYCGLIFYCGIYGSNSSVLNT